MLQESGVGAVDHGCRHGKENSEYSIHTTYSNYLLFYINYFVRVQKIAFGSDVNVFFK